MKKFAEIFPGDSGIKKANQVIRKWILKLHRSNEKIQGTDITVNDLLSNMEVSPFWPRNLNLLPNNSNIDDEECDSQLRQIFDAYNIHGIIVGHTVQNKKGGINLKCTGTLDNGQKTFIGLVDTGASKAFDHFNFTTLPEILIIENNGLRVYKKNKNGKVDLF